MLKWFWLKLMAVDTSVLPSSVSDIQSLLILIVKILFYGLGAAAVVGVVVAGILYLTARDNENQVTKAKTRLFEIVIGLVAWALMWTVLHFLIPGFDDNAVGL